MRFVQNLRYAWRLLLRNRSLNVIILLTLALGIGANTAIFTVDYATLFAPLSYPQPDQLVTVWSGTKANRINPSPQTFVEWRKLSRTFQNLIARLQPSLCCWRTGEYTVDRYDLILRSRRHRDPPDSLATIVRPLDDLFAAVSSLGEPAVDLGEHRAGLIVSTTTSMRTRSNDQTAIGSRCACSSVKVLRRGFSGSLPDHALD